MLEQIAEKRIRSEKFPFLVKIPDKMVFANNKNALNKLAEILEIEIKQSDEIAEKIVSKILFDRLISPYGSKFDRKLLATADDIITMSC